MKNITEETFQQAINSLGDEFDTHEVIQKIMQIEPRQYADELYGVQAQDPIHELHKQIGKYLKGFGSLTPVPSVYSSALLRKDLRDRAKSPNSELSDCDLGDSGSHVSPTCTSRTFIKIARSPHCLFDRPTTRAVNKRLITA